MHLEQVFLVPDIILGSSRLRADVVLREDPARREQQRELAIRALLGRHVVGLDEQALAPNECIDVHDRRPHWRAVIAGPLHAADFVEEREADTIEGRREFSDLVHDCGRTRIVHVIAQRLRNFLGDAPFILALLRLHDRTNAIDATLGINERAVLLQERRAGKEHMRELGGLVQEQVLYDETVEVAQRSLDVVRVRIGLRDVLALDVHATEVTRDGGVEHVRNAIARLGIDRDAPVLLELRAHFVAGDWAVAREFVRERAHVTGTLHVVLAPERVHADARASDVSGRHCKVCHAHDHCRTLAVLGNPEPVVDCGVIG